jgi:hypothetical protein
MIRKMVPLALGLALLTGCGQRTRPTMQRTVTGAEDETIAASDPGDGATCPVSAVPHKTRPTRDIEAIRKRIAERHAKRNEVDVPAAGTEGDDKEGNDGGGILTNSAAAAHSENDPAGLAGPRVRIGPMCLTAPKTWVRQRPPINIVLAQFSLPRVDGDPADAQLTVAAAGRNVSQSPTQWRKLQDRKQDGGSIEQLRIAGSEVVLVDSSSEDDDGSGRRYRVLNATVFAGGKAYFVNCSGPERTVGERAAEFRGFLETLKAAD